MNSNQFPSYFKDIPTIKMYDPLSQFLGSVKDGVLEYRYEDVVKMAGHSCPTVAGAYLLTCKALEALYQDTIPVRGAVQVAFKDSYENGVTGVISSVISNITGACGKGGFKGLNGKFSRDSLMSFGEEIEAQIKFVRMDTRESVLLTYNPNIVTPESRIQELMKQISLNDYNEAILDEFGKLWQKRVKKILIDNYNNKELVKVD